MALTPQQIAEMDSITGFNKATQPTQPKQPGFLGNLSKFNPQTTASGILGTISPFLGRTSDVLQEGIGGWAFGKQQKPLENLVESGYQRSASLIDEATREKDPQRRKQLLQQARDIDAQLRGKTRENVEQGKKLMNITEPEYEELQRDAPTTAGAIPRSIKKGLGAGVELGSYFTPAPKAIKGGTALGRVGRAAAQGGARGAITGAAMGITSPEELSTGERLGKAGKGGLLGGLFGGAISGGAQAGKEVLSKLAQKAQRITAEGERIVSDKQLSLKEQNLKNQYTVPSRKSRLINFNKAIKDVTEDGVYAGPDDMLYVSDQLTGDNGVYTQMTREALKNTNNSVDVSQSQQLLTELSKAPSNATPAQKEQVIKFAMGNVDSASPDIIGQFSDDLPEDLKHQFFVQNMYRQYAPGEIPADQAYELARIMEKQAYKHYNMSTDTLPRPDAEDMGNMYYAFSKNLTRQIDEAVGGRPNLDGLMTPERLQKIENISPKLLDKTKNINKWTDIRALAAPYVKMSQAAESTLDSANSVFGKVARGMQRGSSNLDRYTQSLWAPIRAIPDIANTSTGAGMIESISRPTGKAMGAGANAATPTSNFLQRMLTTRVTRPEQTSQQRPVSPVPYDEIVVPPRQ